MVNPPPKTPGGKARDALAAVLQDPQERARRRDEAGPEPGPNGPAGTLLALALATLTVWVWVSPPVLVRPPPPPPLPAPVAEAELRLTVFQAVLAVEAHAERTGVVPHDLLEILPDPLDTEGLTYERLDPARFRLTGQRVGRRRHVPDR